MTHLSTDRVEVPVGLVAQLSYYQESARKTISQMLMNDVQMAFFLLGNFISTNKILYEYVDELTPFLVQALNDTISKIRSHAVNTLGFLPRYRLSERLIELKVPEKLLDVACHDTHVTVQEFALRVLKQMLYIVRG
ncbi:unnamed protein product [Rotaria socialis]